MKNLPLLLLLFVGISCNKQYDEISEDAFKALTIQDTIVTSRNFVFKVGDSLNDNYSKLLVKSDKNNYYLFDADCRVENDSTILYYYPAFLIDDDGGFRKNGLWVHAEFYTTGTFPFKNDGIRFGVDSIPKNWGNKGLPKKEGIYIFENESLKLISAEQSEEEFKKYKRNGFYFFPNSGRLFDRININNLH